MKHAVSNIALPAGDHRALLAEVAALGVTGIEVAPSRVWKDTWGGLRSADVASYRTAIENAGLEVVGLHSLLFDHRDLGLFGETTQRAQLLELFVHLSAVCRDLGGRTLVWGGGRRRGKVPPEEARAGAVEFFGTLCDRIADHGTVFCLEPLAPSDTDFIHSVHESAAIVRAVARPALRVQIDMKALAANGELAPATFAAVADLLVHCHANEPDFGMLGTSAAIDHAAAGRYLRDIGYCGYVSAEQKMLDPADPLTAVRGSVALLKEAYP